jgi:hypothetical protein
MSKRACALLVALGLSLSIQGCGDDDEGDGGDDGSNNAGTGNAGRGSSGSGNAGSGSGNAGSGNPDDVIAECMAEEMMMGGSISDCDGIEEYSACVEDMCSVQDCASRGCQAYFDCVENAEDPCMPTGCSLPTGDCAACLADVGTCTVNNCIRLIMCGETSTGGSCDQLDDCCAAQPDNTRMLCEAGASAARAGGGDEACEMLRVALCM